MTALARLLDSLSPSSRRGFLGSLGLGAAGIATGSITACSAGRDGSAAAGQRAAVGTELRVGVIGCGGRGTGAAVQVARADRGVRITCLGDLFADHVAASAAILERDAGPQFTCPAGRRFAGADAWRRVIDSDVDLVILATHPAARPGQFAAAVAAGKHVYAEAPAAADLPGVHRAAAALVEARRRGLAVVGGLPSRHDDDLAFRMRRLHAAGSGPEGIGLPLHVDAVHLLGLPWVRSAPQPGRSAGERQFRNWISSAALSGGPLVERHVHAIDRAVWALGDDCPLAALPLDGTAAGPAGPAAGNRVAARFVFAGDRTIHAVVDRRPRGDVLRLEVVEGTHGSLGIGPRSTPEGPHRDRLQFAMHQLVAMIRSGRSVDACDSATALVRSTLMAVLGRTAVEAGREIEWPTSIPLAACLPQAAQCPRPVQS